MTKMLLDTNVLSELVRARPEPRVLAFVIAQTDPLISAITLHELVFGAERLKDPVRRSQLLTWVSGIRNQFFGRIVDIDPHVAEHAARLRAAAVSKGANGDPLDALIAASAMTRGAAIATRNTRDFIHFGATLVDPWSP